MADDIDVFGRKAITTLRPVMADMATIIWHATPTGAAAAGSHLAKATSINLTYQQSVTRRRTLGGNGNVAVIFPSQPQGQLTIGRLVAEKVNKSSPDKLLTELPGWNSCNPLGTLTISFDGESAYAGCTLKGSSYKISGATVQSYSLQADAESLAVMDNLSIEFLQLFGAIQN